jgi:membrane protein implicated in regulation of membrane protease activity
MKKRGWSIRTLMKYTLLQLPAVALLVIVLILARRWVDIPFWMFWGIICLWIAKDVILFPFLWRAYDPDLPADSNSMIGERGVAQERRASSNYILVRGELWRAEVADGEPAVKPGAIVRVQDIRGLTLIVTSEDE